MELSYIKDSINKLSNEDKLKLYNWLHSFIEYDKKIEKTLHTKYMELQNIDRLRQQTQLELEKIEQEKEVVRIKREKEIETEKDKIEIIKMCIQATEYNENISYILPIELWNIIFNYTNIKTQLKFIQTCKYLNKHLAIVDLYNIDDKRVYKQTNDILKQYPYLVKLHVGPLVTDINQLTKLQLLKTAIGLTNNGVKNINPCKLLAYGLKLTDINHMTNLTYLDASNSNISDSGIKNLNLYELDATDNPNITDVNFMTSLKILHTGGPNCGITNNGIKHLKLKKH